MPCCAACSENLLCYLARSRFDGLVRDTYLPLSEASWISLAALREQVSEPAYPSILLGSTPAISFRRVLTKQLALSQLSIAWIGTCLDLLFWSQELTAAAALI